MENAMDRDDVVSTLNSLLETARDGEQGFRSCADHARDPQLRDFFLRGAARCASAVTQLQQQIGMHGGDPAEHGTVAGAMHRGWLNLKSALTTQDDLAMIEECERGEDHAVEVYRDALGKNLPADCRALVERMYEGTVQNHDAVKAMRQTLRMRQSST